MTVRGKEAPFAPVDELAERRLPDWARMLGDIKLGASLTVVVVPHQAWVAENPDKPILDCPEHLLQVQIALVGHEHHPAVLAGQEDKHAQGTVGVLASMPWLKWRKAMDAQIKPGDAA